MIPLFSLIGLFLITSGLAITIFYIIAYWKVFTKAGQPGWGCLIPFYNAYLCLKIAGKPGWWLLLLFIPLVNIAIWIITILDAGKAFGQSTAFNVFLLVIFPCIGVPILAFGKAVYTPPAPAAAAAA